MSQLRNQLTCEQAAAGGCLALIRISHLDKLNASLGHQQTDRLLREIGTVLRETADQYNNGFPARLNGSDFTLLTVGNEQPDELAADLIATMKRELIAKWPQIQEIFHIGIVGYQRGEEVRDLLSAVDKALAIAENKGVNACHALPSDAPKAGSRSAESWRHALTEALNDGRIRLERYPVLSVTNLPLHQEGSARMQLEANGPWLTAFDFMPMALRLKLSSTVDMDVVQIALDHLDQGVAEIAVNLSAETVTDWRFTDDLFALLSRHQGKCKRLWLEVPEYGAFRNFDAFRSFCRRLDPLGCKLGIEHFGQHFGEIAKLAELGLDYLKIDSNYVRSIDTNPGNQEFLRGLCRVAHNAGVLVIAEGVTTEAEFATLAELGFDGATGQEVTRRFHV